MKLLVAVDGSQQSLDGLRYAISHASQYRERPSVELVYVHAPIPRFRHMGLA